MWSIYQAAPRAIDPRLGVRKIDTLAFCLMPISLRGALSETVWHSRELCPISNISIRIWGEMWSMYQIALRVMRPRLDVHIEKPLGFHKLAISPRDAVTWAVWQSLGHCRISIIVIGISIELMAMYHIALGAMHPMLDVRPKMTMSPRDAVV